MVQQLLMTGCLKTSSLVATGASTYMLSSLPSQTSSER